MLNPECEQNHTDCFAYRKGKCKALNNTTFKRYDGTVYKCPFYKPREIGEKK